MFTAGAGNLHATAVAPFASLALERHAHSVDFEEGRYETQRNPTLGPPRVRHARPRQLGRNILILLKRNCAQQ